MAADDLDTRAPVPPGTAAKTMVFEYGFGNTFKSVGAWLAPGSLFDWTSPVANAAAGALDGNAAANRVTGLGGTINTLNWNAGDTLWLRWIERNDLGNDHGLAIDDLSFTAGAAAVPLPAAAGCCCPASEASSGSPDDALLEIPLYGA